jgi:phosphomevalonate kinase
MRASAPGKALILGDYAVLAGGPAMIAAIDTRAIGRFGAGAESVVVDAVLARAGAKPSVAIDTTHFHDRSGNKLGLGSSSAVAVVTAALALGEGSERIFQAALDGHRDASGGIGSGVDVAASYYGGVIATRHQPWPIESLALALTGLHFAIVYTGESTKTGPMVQAVTRSEAWKTRQKTLIALTETGLAAWRARDVDGFLKAVADYGAEMAALGRETRTPIVTDRTAALMAAARAEGAAAKPSGAGGGDIAILYVKDPTLPERIASATGCTLIEARVDPLGLRFLP